MNAACYYGPEAGGGCDDHICSKLNLLKTYRGQKLILKTI
jgi:hypothetical protein